MFDFITYRFHILTLVVSFLATFPGYHFAVVNVAEDVYKDFIRNTFKSRYGIDVDSGSLTLIWALTVVVYNLGDVFGSLCTSFFAERWGRRSSLVIVNNCINIASCILMSLSRMCNSYEMFIVGRAASGFSTGLAYGLLSVYLVEISPPKYRGFAGSTQNLMITINSLMTLIIALPEVLGTTDLFWALQGLPIPFAIIFIALFPFIPQSPKFLYLTRKNESEARTTLKYIQPNISDAEIEDSLLHFSKEDEYSGEETVGWKELFSKRPYRIPILLSVVVNAAIVCTGIVVIFQYSYSMFNALGMSSSSAQLWTILMSVANTMGAIGVIPLMDRIGRRPLLLWGLLACICCDVIFMGFSLLQSGLDTEWPAYPAIIAIFVHVTVFNLGPGAIGWFVVSEMTPQAARSAGATISTASGGIAQLVTNLAYPLLDELVGPWAFLALIVPCAILTYLLYLHMPETQNRPVDEIIAVWFENTKTQPLSLQMNEH